MGGALATTHGASPAEIETARLRTIDLHALKQGSPIESETLYKACCEDGFFYLNLTNDDGKFLDLAEEIYGLSKTIFDLPQCIKMDYDVDKISKMKLNGYKPIGRNVGGQRGHRDGFESYALARNAIMGLTNEPFPHPADVSSKRASVQMFMECCSDAAQAILVSLSRSLRLSEAETLQDFHDVSKPSSDILRLLKYHARPALNGLVQHVPQTPHTDLGSLTFLFTTSPGLQVLPASADTWVWVPPRAGHAIVNVGDMLSFLTNGLLRSSLHRVASFPGRGMDERYSFAFLMRIADETVLRRLDSPLIPKTRNETDITSGDWIAKKFAALRSQSAGQKEQTVLTQKAQSVLV